MNDLLERFSFALKRDKFEAEFKNAMRRRNMTVTSRNGDICVIKGDPSEFTLDISGLRKEYERCPTEEVLGVLMRKIERECDMEARMCSFTNGQEFLRLTVMRKEEVAADMISSDFIGDLCRVIVYTSDDIVLHSLSDSVLKKWGMPQEVAFSVADRNMCRLLAKTEIKKTRLAEGVNAMEFELPCGHLGVSFILCNDFRRTVYQYMGAKFLVAIPSRDSILILENITNNILEKLGNEIVREYKRSEYPLTTDILLFTADDIRIAGHFAVKDKDGKDDT